jgi:hypothetical protein
VEHPAQLLFKASGTRAPPTQTTRIGRSGSCAFAGAFLQLQVESTCQSAASVPARERSEGLPATIRDVLRNNLCMVESSRVFSSSCPTETKLPVQALLLRVSLAECLAGNGCLSALGQNYLHLPVRHRVQVFQSPQLFLTRLCLRILTGPQRCSAITFWIGAIPSCQFPPSRRTN